MWTFLCILPTGKHVLVSVRADTRHKTNQDQPANIIILWGNCACTIVQTLLPLWTLAHTKADCLHKKGITCISPNLNCFSRVLSYSLYDLAIYLPILISWTSITYGATKTNSAVTTAIKLQKVMATRGYCFVFVMECVRWSIGWCSMGYHVYRVTLRVNNRLWCAWVPPSMGY